MNRLFFLIFFGINSLLFSQEMSHGKIFDIEIKRKSDFFKKENNFQKAQFFYLKKEWDSTLFYSMRQLATNSHNKELIDYCHFFRGYGFMNKKLLNEARKEFELVSNAFLFHFKVKIYLGEILLEQNKYKKAIEYFKEIEKLSGNQYYNFKISAVYHNLGLCYFHLKEFPVAEKYLFKSYNLQFKEKDTIGIISSNMDIANLYYEQYKDELAIVYFEKAYQLSKKIKDSEIRQNASLNMAVVEENRGNFSKALTYRKEFENWKDSLNNQNKIWSLAQLEKKFALTKKEKEIKILKTENRLKIMQRNALLISSISLFVLFGTGFYFFRQKTKINKIILAQKKDLDELNLTKDKLFSIVSHDLRSSVNALKTSNKKIFEHLEIKNFTQIDSLIQNNSSITNSVYNLLDNLLNWALLQTKQMYFHKEPLHLFSVVQQVEYNYRPLMLYKNIVFECSIPTDIYVFADLDSLKIILRNLLDNAIKFSKEYGVISLYTLPKKDGFCSMVVQDCGIGMNEETKKELLKESILLSKKNNNEIVGTGLGLQLCKTMIKKNDGVLLIESEENIGTKIIIQLQKIENNG